MLKRLSAEFSFKLSSNCVLKFENDGEFLFTPSLGLLRNSGLLHPVLDPLVRPRLRSNSGHRAAHWVHSLSAAGQRQLRNKRRPDTSTAFSNLASPVEVGDRLSCSDVTILSLTSRAGRCFLFVCLSSLQESVIHFVVRLLLWSVVSFKVWGEIFSQFLLFLFHFFKAQLPNDQWNHVHLFMSTCLRNPCNTWGSPVACK